MATYDGANYAKAITSPSTANILAPGLVGSKLRVWEDTFTFASHAAATVINIAYMRKGAKYMGVCVNHAALGGSATIIIGIAGTTNLFMTAVNAGATAGQKWGLATQFGYEFTANTPVILTTAVSTVTGKISTLFFYTDGT